MSSEYGNIIYGANNSAQYGGVTFSSAVKLAVRSVLQLVPRLGSVFNQSPRIGSLK